MKKILITLLAAGMMLPVSATFAQASTGTGAKAGASSTVRTALITKAVDRANQEITRRISALNALSTRVNAMEKISADGKAALETVIQSQIAAMNALQTKIANDASANATSSLKTDIQSITKSHRIFALIIPVGALEAAADRVMNVASAMTTVAGQLQAKITAAQASSTNMSASVAALADMNAKITDATAQANAAVAGVASLKPDNGVQSVMQSNLAAMKAARAKIQAAQQDLVAARKDVETIMKALSAITGSANASSTASTTTP